MTSTDPKKLDPARAHVLDAPERERFLPTDALVALLALQGDETVVDHGAGTGRLTIPVAHKVRHGGRVVAVDSSAEMLGHLRLRLGPGPNVELLHVTDNAVPRPSGSADRVLAVNLLHEVRGYHDVHGIPEGMDPARPVAVICSSGQRSAVAASLLRRHGAREVIHVADGGVRTWQQHGWPIEQPQPQAAGR